MPIWIALAALAADPLAAATQRAQAVTDRFVAAVRDCGVQPPAPPLIRAEMARGVIAYDAAGILHLYPWQGMDAGTQAALDRLARTMRSGLSGEETYRSIFNELLVAHELGHWLQAGRTGTDRWAGEHDANRIMVAFWREHPAGRATATRLAEYLAFRPGTRNPMPPPPGQPLHEFFNANYAALMRSPAYGWYQNLSSRRAAADRQRPRFCALVRRWAAS